MIIEGRTITTLAELKEFCDAAIAQAKADPAQVRLRRALGVRVHRHEGYPRSIEYDVEVLP